MADTDIHQHTEAAREGPRFSTGITLGTLTAIVGVPASLALLFYIFGLLATAARLERLYGMNPADAWYAASVASQQIVEMQASWYLLLPSALALGIFAAWALGGWVYFGLAADLYVPQLREQARRDRPWSDPIRTRLVLLGSVGFYLAVFLVYALLSHFSAWDAIPLGGVSAGLAGLWALFALEHRWPAQRWLLGAVLIAYVPALVTGLINARFFDTDFDTLPQVTLIVSCPKDTQPSTCPPPKVTGDLLDHSGGIWSVLQRTRNGKAMAVTVTLIPDGSVSYVRNGLEGDHKLGTGAPYP